MQVLDLPLSVALKLDIGFLKVLITYRTFSEAGSDVQQGTRDCGISLSALVCRTIEPIRLPTTLDESSPHFLVSRQIFCSSPGFPFSACDVCATQGRTRFRPIRIDTTVLLRLFISASFELRLQLDNNSCTAR